MADYDWMQDRFNDLRMSRADAKAAGLPQYWDASKPCAKLDGRGKPHGHVLRYTSNWGCVPCAKQAAVRSRFWNKHI